MKFSLEIDSNDAAMAEDGAGETAGLLRRAAAMIECGFRDGILRDFNGNKVGTWYMEEPEEGDE